MESRAGGTTPSSSSRKPFNRSLSNSDVAGYEKNDGSVSDSALSSSVTENRKSRRPSLGYKVAALVGLSKKSSSTSQLPGQGGSEDAQDQSETHYLPPEGHVTADMGVSYEMSSFDSIGGSFERGTGSFDGEKGALTEQRSFDRGGRSLDRGSGSMDRASRSLDRTDSSIDRPGRSVNRGNSVENRTRSVDRAGSYERANGSRTRREGRQMPTGHDGTRSGLAALRQNSADSVTSGYGSSMSRSTGATSSSTRSSVHGKDAKGLGKEGMLAQQGDRTYGQDYGVNSQEYGRVDEYKGQVGLLTVQRIRVMTQLLMTQKRPKVTVPLYKHMTQQATVQMHKVTVQHHKLMVKRGMIQLPMMKGHNPTQVQAWQDLVTMEQLCKVMIPQTVTEVQIRIMVQPPNHMTPPTTQPSQGYGTEAQAYGTANYVKTTQAYGRSVQAFGATSSYGTSTQAYGAASSYGTTTQACGTTSTYGTSTQGFGTTSSYGAGTQGFGTTSSYGTSTQPYGTTSQGYDTAQNYGYGASQQSYGQNQVLVVQSVD